MPPRGQGGGGDGGDGLGVASHFHSTPLQPDASTAQPFNNLAAAACWWAARGWRVFPCRPGDKRPLLRHGHLEASDDVAQVRRWWRRWPQANLGLPCGQERRRPDGSPVYHVVLDVDLPELAARLADDAALLGQAWGVKTPGKRGLHLHLYSRSPVGVVPLKDAEGGPIGELRGQGGYVLLPPSRLASGRYEWLSGPGFEPVVVDDALEWSIALLAEFGVQARAAAGQKGEPLDLSRPIPVGRREMTFFRVFRQAVARGMPPEDAAHLVRVLNETRTEQPLPAEELERQLLKWSRYRFADGSSPEERAARGNGHRPAEADEGRDVIAIAPASYDLAEVVDAAWQAVLKARLPLYRQGAVLVEASGSRAEPVSVPRMRELLARAALWLKRARGDVTPCPPPTDVAEAMVAKPHPDLPELRGIVAHPVLAGGRLLLEDGYDAESGLLVSLPPELKGLDVPERPTEDDVGEAVRLLAEEAFGDFPFADEASRAHTLALVLLPFVRPAIEGPTPLHIASKAAWGAGASLLLRAAAIIATGREPHYLTERRDEDEWRKSISAALRQGSPFVVIDNVSALVSDTLAAALTAVTWTDRLLGTQKTLEAANLATWGASGVNPILGPDIARRTVVIRLEPGWERPWERPESEFRHPDLIGWVREHRRELVRACLVLVARWLASGRPGAREAPPLGGFEAWRRVVGGILEAAGVRGFLQGAHRFAAEADQGSQELKALVRAWWERYGTETVTAAALYEALIKPEGGIRLASLERASTEAGQKRALGHLLRRAVGRTFELPPAVRLVSAGTDHRGTALFRLQPLEGGPPPKTPKVPKVSNPVAGDDFKSGPLISDSRGDSGGKTFGTFGTFGSSGGPSQPGQGARPSPPHGPSPCPRCQPAGLPGYYMCERGQEVTLVRAGIDREKHILRRKQALRINIGLLRAVEPDFIVASFSDGSWGWTPMEVARKAGKEGEFGAERQLAIPLSAFNWVVVAPHLPGGGAETPDSQAGNPGQNPGQPGKTPGTETPDKTPDTGNPGRCPACGGPLAKPRRGPPPRWCSDLCRKRAARKGVRG